MANELNPRVRKEAMTRDGDTEVNLYGNLTIVEYKQNEYFIAEIWGPRSKRATHYQAFKTEKERYDALCGFKNQYDRKQQEKQAEKEEEQRQQQEFMEKIELGTILVCQWGYDQTNVDFYQVTGKKEATITVRPIRSTVKETGFMSGPATPIPNDFTGREERHRVHGNCITVGYHQYARIWNGEPVHQTWYA